MFPPHPPEKNPVDIPDVIEAKKSITCSHLWVVKSGLNHKTILVLGETNRQVALSFLVQMLCLNFR